MVYLFICVGSTKVDESQGTPHSLRHGERWRERKKQPKSKTAAAPHEGNEMHINSNPRRGVTYNKNIDKTTTKIND
jgi:hypothetical protein